MNGRSKESPPVNHTYSKKLKKRSFNDQTFDNVFLGIPYDDNDSNDSWSEESKTVGHELDKLANKTANLNKDSVVPDLCGDIQNEDSFINSEELSQRLSSKLQNTLRDKFSLSPDKEIIALAARGPKGRKRSGNKENKPKDKTNSISQALSSCLEGTFRIEPSSPPTANSGVLPPDSNYYFGNQQSPQKLPTQSENSNTLTSFKYPLPPKRLKLFFEMTDYQEEQSYNAIANGDGGSECNVATLLNMGNTCFLNSVLYALRFAPTFLHNLHHLLVDLRLINGKLRETKTKTSSLGRNGSAVSGSSWRSASSKDLLSIGNSDLIPKSKDQIVTEKLHALFVTMNNLETKGTPDPFQPEALLQAVRDANPMFEGNHQQDAHEFFVELLSCLRVTCDKLNEQIEQNPDLIKSPEPTSAAVNNNSKMFAVRKSWKIPLKKRDRGSAKKNGDVESDVGAADSEENLSHMGSGESIKKKFGYNFIAEDFQGVSLHRTKCLECEEISELKEPFLEIQVPVNYREEDYIDSSIFGSICVTSEKLCDQNKYFCENCNRYNEAQRTVLYEKLPNIMVLHLKRFTTSLSGVQKVNTYVPTPLEIRCFCESCGKIDKSKTTPHKYQLSCVIMHLGASIASGHYIAYSRAAVETCDYTECSRDIPKGYFNSSSKEMSANFMKFFNKARALSTPLSETQNGIGSNSKKNDSQVCQSVGCCGIRCKLNLGAPSRHDDWLEFDDEKVKLLSNKEFVDMLNRRHDSTNTPYLLFYSKM